MSKMARIATAVFVLALVPGTIAGQERVEGMWFATSTEASVYGDSGDTRIREVARKAITGHTSEASVFYDSGYTRAKLSVGCIDVAEGPHLFVTVVGLATDDFFQPVNYVFEWGSGERNTYTAQVEAYAGTVLARFTPGDTRKMIPKLVSEWSISMGAEAVSERIGWSLSGSGAAINSLHCVGH